MQSRLLSPERSSGSSRCQVRHNYRLGGKRGCWVSPIVRSHFHTPHDPTSTFTPRKQLVVSPHNPLNGVKELRYVTSQQRWGFCASQSSEVEAVVWVSESSLNVSVFHFTFVNSRFLAFLPFSKKSPIGPVFPLSLIFIVNTPVLIFSNPKRFCWNFMLFQIFLASMKYQSAQKISVLISHFKIRFSTTDAN